MTAVQTLAEVFGRLGTLAGVYGVDLGPMLRHLGDLAPELSRHILVTVPHTFDRIAVATRLRPELVGSTDTPQLTRVARLGAASAAELDIELESQVGGGFATTVRAIGNRVLDTDLANLAAIGVAPEPLQRLRDVTLALGGRTNLIALSDREVGGATSIELHVRRINRLDDDRDATRERIDAAGLALGATGPQRRVVASLHDALAKERDSYAVLELAGDELKLGVRWVDVRWETAIRMMLGFYPGLDAGTKLGELSGAFDAPHAAAVELRLGPSEPPAMYVAVSGV